MRKKLAILLCCTLCLTSLASGIGEAYKALSVYDYFKAKKLFYKSLKQSPKEASFGLATIFYRADNPFSNIDSAARYIAISRQSPAKGSQPFFRPGAVDSLSELISVKGFEQYMARLQVPALEKFLRGFYFAAPCLRQSAYDQRDSIRLAQLSAYNSSDSVKAFLWAYPESAHHKAAFAAYEQYVFREQVKAGTPVELKAFIAHYPASRHRPEAEQALFQQVKNNHQPAEIYDFISRYSSALTKEQAWKYLYSVAVTHYSEKELQDFLQKYPDYPYKQHVEKEINLSAAVLLPLKNNADRWGYADTLGNWLIAPAYDDAAAFSEGFAAVCSNDSCFYIDKEGKKASASIFSEVSDYHQGVAVVKQQDHYFLINRTGQLISQAFDELSDPSGHLYVAKQHGRYGAVNRRGAWVIPATYDKLGDFKHGYAYYVSGKYGLVDTLNKVHEALWDWISDVENDDIAMVKRGSLFGLLRAPGQLILPADYDYIKPCGASVFLVVKNGLYGFYDAAAQCFIAEVAYEYDAAREPGYYSNGRLFKLVLDEEVAMADANGHMSIAFGKYEDVFFAKDDMIRIQKNGRFGFADRKLKMVIAPDYEKASDFAMGQAIVEKKGSSSIIDKTGKAIFTCKDCGISAFAGHYLVEVGDLKGLLDASGSWLLQPVYSSIEAYTPKLLIARDAGGMWLFDIKTKALKKSN